MAISYDSALGLPEEQIWNKPMHVKLRPGGWRDRRSERLKSFCDNLVNVHRVVEGSAWGFVCGGLEQSPFMPTYYPACRVQQIYVIVA
jgi:hypothetical protein